MIWPEHIVENYLNGFDVVRELNTECTVVFKTELEKDDFLDQLEKANFLSSKELDRALCGVSAKSSPSYIAKKETLLITQVLNFMIK